MNRFSTAFLLLAVPAGLIAQQAAPATWEIGHADAKVLIGADFGRLRASQVGQSYSSQMQQLQQAGPLMFPIPGLALLSDIDKIFLSSPGNKTAGVKGNPPFLLVLEGTFPEEHSRLLRNGPVHLYRAVKIYGPSSSGNPSMAFPDAHTVLIGDEKSLRDAIDRHGHGTQGPAPLLERAAALASNNDIWLIARDSMSNLQPAGVPVSPLAADMEGMEASVSLRDGFALQLSLETKTEEAARQLAQLLTTQMQTAMATKLDGQQAAELMRNFRISAEGTRMGVNVSLTKEELEKQMQTMQNSRRAFAPAPAPVTPEPKPNTPRTVKIYGLSDGVREIPLK